VAAAAYSRAGWTGVAAFGVALPLAGFVVWLTERSPGLRRCTEYRS
jgi:hypothetical protein